MFSPTILVLAASLLPAADAPLVGRPSDHFYNAVGEHVALAMSARPTEIRVEDEIQLVVRVSGLANGDQLQRPDLRQLPEFARGFHIDDIDDGPDAGQARGERTFRYRLRPKSDKVLEIPPLVFRYWQPRLQYFAMTAPPEAIPLTIRPRPPSVAEGLPLAGPDFLFEIAAVDVERQRSRPASNWIPVWLLAGPGLACCAWLYLWYLRDPRAAARSGMRRLRAVRTALDALHGLPENRDSVAATRIANIVQTYLCQRWSLSVAATTPGEIANALERVLLNADIVEHARKFFRNCDAVRFGPAGSGHRELVPQAIHLIEELERQACQRESAEPREPRGTPKLIALLLACGSGMVAAGDELKHLIRNDLVEAEVAFQRGIWARGNDQEARPLFRQAAERYGNLQKEFHLRTVEVLGNEGNARMLAGDSPGAIAAYRRGLALDPDHAGLNRALAYARSQVAYADPQERSELAPRAESFSWLKRFLRTGSLAATALLAPVGWIGLTRWLMVRGRWLLVLGGVSLGAAVLCAEGRLLETRLRARDLSRLHGVMTESVVLRTGDGPSFPPRRDLPLPAGVEVVVRTSSTGWSHLELADGTLGWVPSASIMPLDTALPVDRR